MQEKNIHILFAKTKNEHMTLSEKSEMRHFLLNNFEKKSVFSMFSFSYTRYAVVGAFVFILGIGTVGAAENSLPGDILYPVKTKFTEPVTKLLAFSPDEKADFESEIAERRVVELETLSKKGKLTTETKTKIKKDFERALTNSREELGVKLAVRQKNEKTIVEPVVSLLAVEEPVVVSPPALSRSAMFVPAGELPVDSFETEIADTNVLEPEQEQAPEAVAFPYELEQELEKALEILLIDEDFQEHASQLNEQMLSYIREGESVRANMLAREILLLVRFKNIQPASKIQK